MIHETCPVEPLSSNPLTLLPSMPIALPPGSPFPRIITMRTIPVLGLLLLLNGCAALLQPQAFPEPAGGTETGDAGASAAEEGDVARPAPRVALLESRNIDAQIRKRTDELARREEPGLPRTETGYYLDVQEAQLRQHFPNKAVGLFRNHESILLLISGMVAFETNSARLNPEAESILATISRVLEDYRNTLLVVSSHTDRSGDEERNRKLSEARAITVAHFLVEQGLPSERIVAVGHGEERPLALNETSPPADRWPDRRIEIRLEVITENTP